MHNAKIKHSPVSNDQLDGVAAHRSATPATVERALVDAAQAQDWAQVAAIVDQHWARLLLMHPRPLRQALHMTPIAALTGSPVAVATREMLGIKPAAPGSLPRLLSPSERTRVGRSPQARRALEVNLAAMIVARRRGCLDLAASYRDQLDDIARAADQNRIPGPAGLAAFSLTQSAILSESQGDSAHAEQLLREAFRGAPASEFESSARYALARLALLSARRVSCGRA